MTDQAVIAARGFEEKAQEADARAVMRNNLTSFLKDHKKEASKIVDKVNKDKTQSDGTTPQAMPQSRHTKWRKYPSKRS